MKHQVSPPFLRLTTISAVVLLLVGIAGHFIQAAGSPSSTIAGGGLLRQPQANSNGLVAWYRLDGDAKDASGNNNNGTLTNFNSDATDGYVQGKFGNGLKFDGVDDYVVTSGISQPTAYTISAWVNTTVASSIQFFATMSSGIGSDVKAFDLSTDASNHFVFDVYGTTVGSVVSTTTYTLGAYYHLVGTFDGTQATFYVNGISVGKATPSGLFNPTSPKMYFGRNTFGSAPFTRFLSGSLDDARIYNRVLSSTEITALYQGSSPANFDQFTKNYYPLDDNSGDAALTRLHQTGTSNNGTLTNSPTWGTGKYGNALSFNGSTGYVDIGDVLNEGISNWSMGAWVKTTQTANASNLPMIVSKRNSTLTGNSGYQLFQNQNQGISFAFGDGSTTRIRVDATAPVINDGIWHFVSVAFTRSGNGILYVDGVAATSGSGSIAGQSSSVSNSQSLQIGREGQSSVNFWQGSIDDARIYNTALSATDVADLYAGKSLFSQRSALVGYWDLDEGTGTTAYDHSTDNSAILAPGGAAWTSGNFGSAVSLTAASFGSLSIPDEAMTLGSVEFWINPTTITGDQRLISQASGASTQAGQLALNQYSGESGSLWVWDGSAWQRLADTGTIGAGVWNHIVVDYSGASATAFVNGVQTYTLTTACAFSGVPLSFGGLFLNTTGGYFNGLVDDLRFSSRIIQDYEAADHYRLGV